MIYMIYKWDGAIILLKRKHGVLSVEVGNSSHSPEDCLWKPHPEGDNM